MGQHIYSYAVFGPEGYDSHEAHVQTLSSP